MTTHYETHLTVDLKDKTLEDFKKACELIQAKPVIINLKDVKQVMTSKTTITNTVSSIYAQALEDVVELQNQGFEVVRTKVETNKIELNTRYKYVEIHVPCHTRKLIEYPNIINELPLFDIEGNQIKGHISRNEFKPNVTFITWRSRVIEDFEHFNIVYGSLIELSILADPSKDPKLEIILHDSNEELDSEWLNGKEIK